MATELPKIRFKRGKKEYYYDARLHEVRNVENPLEAYGLTNDEDASIDYFTRQGRTELPFALKDLRVMELREDESPYDGNAEEELLKRARG